MPDFKKVTEVFANPRVAATLIFVAGTALLAGILQFFLEHWIPALIATLVIVLVVLLAVIAWSVYSREREERLLRGTRADGAETGPKRVRGTASDSLEQAVRYAVAQTHANRAASGLPWYLVIGPPGVGKTVLLKSSGLDLPAEVANLVRPGPTAHCQWWLTNKGVFIDTAGRFVSSDDATDRADWRHLLRLLRRLGARPTLRGVLLVLPAALFNATEDSRLEEAGAQLRRRLNEIMDELGIDPPIYVAITQMDRVRGFPELVAALPGGRPQEALGWTLKQRHPGDVGATVREGFEVVRRRLERWLPDLLLREADPEKRGRIFLFPQELGAMSRSVATFLRRAFAPSSYDAPPFLRGVYFASALRDGESLSSVLDRLAPGVARPGVERGGPGGGWFARDLFRFVMLDPEEQTLSRSRERVGPRTRVMVYALSSAIALVVLGLWGVSFARSWTAMRGLATEARVAVAERQSIATFDRLREAILEREATHRSRLQRAGLGGPLESALVRARQLFVLGFAREFEQPAKAKLLAAVRQSDDAAFAALQDLATDVSWLLARGVGDPAFRPAISTYTSVGESAPEVAAFGTAYDAFLGWAPEDEVQQRIDDERRRLEEEAPRLLELGRLERWCELHPEMAPGVAYSELAMPEPPPGTPTRVLGCYTRSFWEKRLQRQISGLEATKSAATSTIATFRDAYSARYEEAWRRFLVSSARPARIDPAVKRSPYLDLVARVDEHTRVAGLWKTGPPEWVRTLQEIRRADVPVPAPTDGKPVESVLPSGWKKYLGALEEVGADVERARTTTQAAFEIADSAAGGKDTSFRKAITLIEIELVKLEGGDESSRTAKLALRETLAMPVLDGFSSVLQNAVIEVEQMWRDRVVARCTPPLVGTAVQTCQDAKLRFKDEVLSRFVLGNRPRTLLVDRAMPISERTIAAVFGGGATGAGGGGGGGGGGGDAPTGPQTVRFEGVPSQVLGDSDVFVTRTELTLLCANPPEQKFEYFDGTGSRAFTWSPECNNVLLQAWVRGADGRERELRREFSGAFAFAEFLRAGRPTGGASEWVITDSSVRIAARYRVRGAEGVIRHQQQANQSVPGSLRQ